MIIRIIQYIYQASYYGNTKQRGVGGGHGHMAVYTELQK